MIRLILALMATMFLTFVIAGADRGQVRYGLMTTGATPVAAQTRSPQTLQDASDPVAVAVYVPSAPVIDLAQADVANDATEVDALAEAVAQEVADLPAPVDAEAVDGSVDGALAEPVKIVRFVAVNSANVRDGPSKDFSVIEKLARGEAVTVVAANDAPEGWTLIRIEGDGLEGYVSTALLSDQP